MAHPHEHAKSSARKFGGDPTDYVKYHAWFDQTKAQCPDARHRVILHNSFGIFLLEQAVMGKIGGEDSPLLEAMKRALRYIQESRIDDAEAALRVGINLAALGIIRNSNDRAVPLRLIGEQHVLEDFGNHIPSLTQIIDHVALEPWMGKNAIPLSKLLEMDSHEGEE